MVVNLEQTGRGMSARLERLEQDFVIDKLDVISISRKVGDVSGKQLAAAAATNLNMKKSKHKRKLLASEDRTDAKVMKMVRDEEADPKRPKEVAGSKKSRGFSWSNYLRQEEAQPAPVKAFKNVSVVRIS